MTSVKMHDVPVGLCGSHSKLKGVGLHQWSSDSLEFKAMEMLLQAKSLIDTPDIKYRKGGLQISIGPLCLASLLSSSPYPWQPLRHSRGALQ